MSFYENYVQQNANFGLWFAPLPPQARGRITGRADVLKRTISKTLPITSSFNRTLVHKELNNTVLPSNTTYSVCEG